MKTFCASIIAFCGLVLWPSLVDAAFQAPTSVTGTYVTGSSVYVNYSEDFLAAAGYSYPFTGVSIAILDQLPVIDQASTSAACYGVEYDSLCAGAYGSTTQIRLWYNNMQPYGWVVPRTFYIAWVRDGGVGDRELIGYSSVFVDSSGVPTVVSGVSSIISVSPNNGELVLTRPTTTIEIEYYNAGDYDQIGVQIQYQTSGYSSTTPAGYLYWDVASIGTSTFQVLLTDLATGSYFGYASLVDSTGQNPNVEEFFTFAQSEVLNAFFGFNNGGEVYTSYVNECGWDNLDVVACLFSLVIPTPSLGALLWQQANEGIFKRFPFGYVTRLAEILTGQAGTTTLPSVVLTVPEGLPGAGQSVDLSPWSVFDEGSFLREGHAYGTTTPFFTFALPLWNTLWIIAFIGWIVSLFLSGKADAHVGAA